jgi:aconitate hydratase
MPTDLFNARDVLKVGKNEFVIYRLDALEHAGLVQLAKLPFSIRIMLEGVLRQCNGREITLDDVKKIAAWQPHGERPSVPFLPARVLMHDTTGLPALVDFAAMRSAAARMGLEVKKINPLVQADLIVDHSLQVDFFGTPDAIQRNTELEFKRNRERYEFLKWAQTAYANLRVVPPSTGILHQVNLEYIADVVRVQKVNGEMQAFPDSLVGTDSHTPMINALGVVGWGVGGIEAEAVMLGQPTDMLLPDVIGVKLYGRLAEGVTATDLVLTITQMLRKKGVVEKFVEFFGPGLDHMPVADRATIANMAPEYGATMGFFPTDRETLRYLHLTGRSAELIERVEMVLRAQGLFREEDTPAPEFTDTLELDLGTVVPSLAGPKRPQDRVPLSEIKQAFQFALTAPIKQRGYELPANDLTIEAPFDDTFTLKHGSVVLAAITACTNTSNPNLMIAAGLLAQKAVDKGLSVKPYVKTSLAPGSRVVTEYLRSANLLEPLNQLGFNIVGYGCTTCVGNSGPLPEKVVKIILENNLVVAAVLSGNRNFAHPLVDCANYLASPPLIIRMCFWYNGSVLRTAHREWKDGAVYLRDIYPKKFSKPFWLSSDMFGKIC